MRRCVKLRCFFFSSRRRHTRFDCDWSSDVCSADLLGQALKNQVEIQAVQGKTVLQKLDPRGEQRLRLLLADGGSRKKARSEERRVGKECRSRWQPYSRKQNSALCLGIADAARRRLS